MINCELFSHVYFAIPPKPRSCAYIDSLRNLAYEPKSDLKIGPFTTLCYLQIAVHWQIVTYFW